MARMKKDDGRGGWSKPVIKGPKPKKSSKPSKAKPRTLGQISETQRRGMAETRARAVAKRPNRPITAEQARAVRQRDKERRQDSMSRGPATKRARDRMRAQY